MEEVSTPVRDRPKRWDLPFSMDFGNEAEQREMSLTQLNDLFSRKPFSEMDSSRFPASLPLESIVANDTRIRLYREGDTIVRQGDYGNSAFLILEGDCRAIIEGLDPSMLGRQSGQSKSLLKSVTGLFTNALAPEVRDSRLYPQHHEAPVFDPSGTVFVQDVPNILELSPNVYSEAKHNVIPEGSLFGELAALGRVQRSVTVVAAGPGTTTLLEIRWQGLRDLMKFDSALRDHINQLFRQNGLQGAFQTSPLIQAINLDEEQWDQLLAEAQFETFGSYDWHGTYQELRQRDGDLLTQEPVVQEEGHYPNGLLIVRAGFARMSRRHGAGEYTLGYLGKGDVHGIKELMHNVSSDDQSPIQTTLRAAGYTDVVRVPTRTFEQVIYPAIMKTWPDGNFPEKFLGERMERQKTAASPRRLSRRGDHRKEEFSGAPMMEFLAENRYINGTATMLIDLDRCTRCDDCVQACASGHNNNPRFIRHGETHDHYMIANACMHCADPVCMIGCPTGAIHRSEGGGEVVINDVTCIGCGTCANSCPYENIRLVNVRDKSQDDALMVDANKGKAVVKATKCDLCVEHHGGPACVRACPHDALTRADMSDLLGLSEWLNR